MEILTVTNDAELRLAQRRMRHLDQESTELVAAAVALNRIGQVTRLRLPAADAQVNGHCERIGMIAKLDAASALIDAEIERIARLVEAYCAEGERVAA